jgi:hypothetical protein
MLEHISFIKRLDKVMIHLCPVIHPSLIHSERDGGGVADGGKGGWHEEMEQGGEPKCEEDKDIYT